MNEKQKGESESTESNVQLDLDEWFPCITKTKARKEATDDATRTRPKRNCSLPSPEEGSA